MVFLLGMKKADQQMMTRKYFQWTLLKPMGAVCSRIMVAITKVNQWPCYCATCKLTSKLSKQRETHTNRANLSWENLGDIEVHSGVTECSAHEVVSFVSRTS